MVIGIYFEVQTDVCNLQININKLTIYAMIRNANLFILRHIHTYIYISTVIYYLKFDSCDLKDI